MLGTPLTAHNHAYPLSLPAVFPLPFAVIWRHRASFHICAAEEKPQCSEMSSGGAISSVLLYCLTVLLPHRTAAISTNPPSSQITHSENIPHFLSQKTCSGYHSTGWRAGGGRKYCNKINQCQSALQAAFPRHAVLHEHKIAFSGIFSSRPSLCARVCVHLISFPGGVPLALPMRKDTPKELKQRPVCLQPITSQSWNAWQGECQQWTAASLAAGCYRNRGYNK